MKVVIIGANGFIGHTLTAHILATTGWSVTGVDRNDDRLRPLFGHPRLDFAHMDIRNSHARIERLVAAADVVLPLAAYARPADYVRDPLAIFELDFEENLHIVRAAERHGTRIVFPSTSEVYGMCPDAAFNEDRSPLVLGPIAKERWIYSCSKQLLDRVIWAMGGRGLRFTLFRPFNWFGPGLDDIAEAAPGSARVVTQFMGHLLRGEPLQLVDGGHQRRAFTYIDDGIAALMRILVNENGAADGRIFNIGNPANDRSIRDLAALMIDVIAEFPGYADLAETATIVETPGATYYGSAYQDVDHRQPDISAATRWLDWTPRVGLREGLRHMANHYINRTIPVKLFDEAVP